jgi:predicted nucleotidyltransferase
MPTWWHDKASTSPEMPPPAMRTVMDLTDQQRSAVAELCHRFGVQKLDVFGSAANGKFNPAHSDIDFLVEFSAEHQAVFSIVTSDCWKPWSNCSDARSILYRPQR